MPERNATARERATTAATPRHRSRRDIPDGNRAERRRSIHGHWGIPRDRNEKARIQAHAQVLMRATVPGRHYGAITAKHFAVMLALLWRFHDARTGRCFPSHEAIAEAAGCARSTVQLAIRALEAAGLLTWVRRWARAKVQARDAADRLVLAVRVVRDSNAYAFPPPPACARAGVPTNATPAPATLRPVVRGTSDTEARSGSEIPSSNETFANVARADGPPRAGSADVARGQRPGRGDEGHALVEALGRLAAARRAAAARGR